MRWQLIASFVIIHLITGIVAGVVVIYNAHEATAVEVAASMEVAEQVVRATADRLAQDASYSHPESSPLQALESLPLRLRNLRHVRISIADASGRPVFQPADVDGDGRHTRLPRWFAGLLKFGTLSREIPVTLSGQFIGTVVVTSKPADEFAEVWHDVSELAVVVLIADITVIGLFCLVLGRVLNPLTSLAAGLRELEQGRFRYRLPRPRVRELADIVDRFNALAGALESAKEDNARLNRRLITVQDDERREIATELHDELGACLFGLRANVLSVQRLADSLPPGDAELMRKRTATLVEVSERIQATNRRVLRRIRPMALGHAALADVIRDLVADFERNSPEQTFEVNIGRLRHGYGDCIDLTVYRCVQEGLTNAMRHAGSKTVTITLDEITPPAQPNEEKAPVALCLSILDDGRGFAPGTSPGLGLTGMEERVSALGGALNVSSRPAGGAHLEITIPVEDAEPLRPVAADGRGGQQ